MLFAWAFEMTPEGLKRESEVDRSQSITPQTGKKLNLTITVVMALALGYFAYDKFVLSADRETVAIESAVEEATAQAMTEQAATEEALAESDKSIAVLPFVAMSSGEDDEYFADGLTEEILNALTRLPDLLVTARTSAFAFKGKNLEIPVIAKALGVQHVVEGSVRRSGERIRVTAQLIRAQDGFHLWSDTYDRTLEDIFAIQEEIAQSIARALDVVLDDEMREVMARTGTRNVDAFINRQKGYELYQRAHAGLPQIATLMAANRYFEAAIEQAPRYSDPYLFHSDLYTHLLMLNAAGAAIPEVAVGIMSSASASLDSDLKNASETAVHDVQRLNASLARVLLSDDWRRAPGLLRSITVLETCFESLWLHLVAPFGYADYMIRVFERIAQCDPAAELGWTHASMMALWAGNLDRARAIAKSSTLALAEHDRVDYTLMVVLLAQGEYEQYESQLESVAQVRKLQYRVMLAAARNQIADARQHADRYWENSPANDRDALRFAAIMGDREQANALATVIDAKPIGPTVLLLMIYHCACGAPFDLSAAPNFQRLISEAQFNWPPPSPIKYPAKDW
jgi:TolB-like protein